MPCHVLKSKDSVMIVCSRGCRHKKCFICGKLAKAYCDVCDRPICSDHAQRVDVDTDVCPEHNNIKDIQKAIERRMALK